MSSLPDNHIQFLEASGANLYFLDLIQQQMCIGQKGWRFLDIGCGTAILAQCVSLATGMTAHGTEMSLAAYQIASARIDCTFVENIFLPYDNEYFDLVIAKDVLPMIQDKALWFREICRVLRKDGKFITYMPENTDFLSKPLYAFIPGSEQASRLVYGEVKDVISLLRLAGFTKVYSPRVYLGTVRQDLNKVAKHRSGFFNNTDNVQYENKRQLGMDKLDAGIVSLASVGISAHYEWERTALIGVR